MTERPACSYPINLHGWFRWQMEFTDILQRTKPKECVEVGTWLGASAIFIGHQIKEWGGKLYCIDPWLPGWYPGDATVANLEQDSYDRFRSNVWESGLQEVITPMRGRSVNFSGLFEHGSVEFCYIDGDHNYMAVREDLEIWWPRMKKGYIICGDDFHGLGVAAAWHNVLKGRFETNGDQLVWAIKD